MKQAKKLFKTTTGDAPEGVKSRVYLKAWAGAENGGKAKYQFKLGVNKEPTTPDWDLKHTVFDKVVEIRERENMMPFEDEAEITVYDKQVRALQKDNGAPDGVFESAPESPTDEVVNRMEAKNFMDQANQTLREAASIQGDKLNKLKILGWIVIGVGAATLAYFAARAFIL